MVPPADPAKRSTFTATILTRTVRITHTNRGGRHVLMCIEDVDSGKPLPISSEFGHEARTLMQQQTDA